MKRNIAFTVIFIVIGLFASACQPNVVIQPTPTSDRAVPPLPPTETPISIPTETAAPTALPTTPPTGVPASGSIAGKLGYPADAMPAVHIVAFLIGTDTTFSMDTQKGQMSYQLDGLLEGSYHVIAYTIGDGSFPEGLSGGYTKAAICGMGESCTDHTLAEVTVKAGARINDVNLTDWLIPTPPKPEPGQPVSGAITGQLSYPSQFIPPMRVVAYRLSDNLAFYVDTKMNDGTYTLPLPAGSYHVAAYVGGAEAGPQSMAGGYSQAVPCGLSVDCTDHSLIEVSVVKGSVTYNVNPGDFYAPEGTFPPYSPASIQ